MIALLTVGSRSNTATFKLEGALLLRKYATDAPIMPPPKMATSTWFGELIFFDPLSTGSCFIFTFLPHGGTLTLPSGPFEDEEAKLRQKQ